MRSIPEWVKEGAEVVESPSTWGRVWGKVRKIGKVRKNGLFVLEGDDSLWTPNDTYASPTKSNWSARTLRPFTGENREEAKKSWQVDAARDRLIKYVQKLEKACGHWDADVILAEAAKLPPEEPAP